jgi:hypothetical protein
MLIAETRRETSERARELAFRCRAADAAQEAEAVLGRAGTGKAAAREQASLIIRIRYIMPLSLFTA